MITHIRIILAASCFIASGCAEIHRQADTAKLKATTTQEVIVFRDGTFTIRGKPHRFPFYLADLSATLGPPDRTTHLENVLSTWDRVGIVAYEKKPGDPISAISITFAERDYDFSPSVPFSGTLQYHDVQLTRNSERDDLTAAGLIQDDVLPFLHVADDGDFRIIAEYDRGLVEFAINE